ncbi:MAG: hypothetical protein QOI84_889 [Solirubrobacterales bacterium]|jgi:hypothetical protein|nr:hypothetical protein [Solirubrobacterales bacterium]
MSAASEPLSDPVAEGGRITTAAAEGGVPLRITGGVAVAIRCPSAAEPPLKRIYGDIDLVTVGAAGDGVEALLEGLGYAGDREFNILHGHRRLIFWDARNQRQVDVFVDEAKLCHTIDFRRRLEAVPLTLSLADLTVMKLQVVETNEKDFVDLCAIFADHDLSDDDSGVNRAYLGELTASDWGLWRTLGMVAERAERFALDLPGFEAGERVAERLRRLRSGLDAVPKTRGWRMRARVGDRKRWYELPEEVH